jgi:predicted nucleic acid-binding protein
VARTLFRKHAEAGDMLLSTQVLQEFYVAVTRKLARPLAGADEGAHEFAIDRGCRTRGYSPKPEPVILGHGEQ